MSETKEARKGTGYHGVDGAGYFNKAKAPSAFTARVNDAAREPFTTRTGQVTTIDVANPEYHEAMTRAWEGLRSDLAEDKGSKLWTMPWQERDRLDGTVRESGIRTMEEFDGLAEQAATFGIESLNPGQKAAVELGKEAFGDALSFAAASGRLDPDSGKTPTDPYGELRDTGRYVTLEAPDGSVSGYMMELDPSMDVHRFLDLECPEGQAQILALKDDAYKIHGVWEKSPLIEAGIQAARNHMAEYGTVLQLDGRGVQRSELVTQLDRMNAAMAETDAREAEGRGDTGHELA